MHIDFDRLNDAYPVEQVLRTRFNVKVINGTFKCPFHDDRNESGSIYRDPLTGRTRFKCHAAGCEVGGDAMDLARLATGSDDVGVQHRWLTGDEPTLGPRPASGTPRPRAERRDDPGIHRVFDLAPIPPECLKDILVGKPTPEVLHAKGFRKSYTPRLVHAYVNRDNRTVLLIIRIDNNMRGKSGKPGKAFIPLRWDRREGWCSTSFQPGEERLFYREVQLALYPDRPVLVLEGEHKTDLVAALPAFDDYVVISWAGGAATMKHQRWAKLKGRRVVFWPDADPTGNAQAVPDTSLAYRTQTATEAAARACEAAEVRIVEPLQAWLDKDCGYDVKDLLEEMRAAGNQAAEVRALMESLAVPLAPDMPPPPGQDLAPPENDLPWVLKHTRGGAAISPRDESNLLVWLEHLPADQGGYKGRLARDVFTHEILLDGEPLPEGIGPRRIAHEIARQGVLVGVTADKIQPIIADVADLNPVNRLADEIRALAWDKRHRLLLQYAGADVRGESGKWARVAGHRWLVGLLRRILEPGWKHDGVLVLVGKQGLRKTVFFEAVGDILGRDLFVEIDRLTRDPDTQMLLKGKCVVELSEMTAHRHGDTDSLKGMLTSRFDHYRRPYARSHEKVPRTCVFGGSTNNRKFLKDLTGNRRYWVVPIVHPMDIEGLRQDMPQLLAQALYFIEHGVADDAQNWLTPAEESMQEGMAKLYEIEYPQFAGLDAVLEGKDEIASVEIWDTLQFQTAQRTPPLNEILRKLMEERGWIYGRHNRHVGGHDRWTWKRDPDDSNAPTLDLA